MKLSHSRRPSRDIKVFKSGENEIGRIDTGNFARDGEVEISIIKGSFPLAHYFTSLVRFTLPLNHILTGCCKRQTFRNASRSICKAISIGPITM